VQVPAEVFISEKHHLKAVQNCELVIGGIVVQDDALTPLKAVSLLQ